MGEKCRFYATYHFDDSQRVCFQSDYWLLFRQRTRCHNQHSICVVLFNTETKLKKRNLLNALMIHDGSVPGALTFLL